MRDNNVLCKKFPKKLQELRKKRWSLYKDNQDKYPNPYEKFSVCQSQDTMAEALTVERRTYGKWESGKTFPTIDKVADICNILDCNIDYLLGAEKLVGFSQATIASHYSKIDIDIVDKAMNDSDYRDFLNYFMHPNNCYALVQSTTRCAWREHRADIESGKMEEPLKTLIADIFHSYQTFTSVTQYKEDSLREHIVSSLPQNRISFKPKKSDNCICISTCLSTQKINELGISNTNPQNYHLLVDYLVDYCFNVLVTKEIIDTQKEKLGHLFVRMVEKFLEEE